MTPAMYIAAIKDGVIIIAVVVLLWFVYSRGQDSIKVKDLQGLQTAITNNAKTEATWRTNKDAADDQLKSDVATISASSSAPKQPVWVCNKNNSNNVPANTGSAVSTGSPVGPTVAGSGHGIDATSSAPPVEPYDVRPAIEAFKKTYETTLAECRNALNQWPAQPKS